MTWFEPGKRASACCSSTLAGRCSCSRRIRVRIAVRMSRALALSPLAAWAGVFAGRWSPEASCRSGSSRPAEAGDGKRDSWMGVGDEGTRPPAREAARRAVCDGGARLSWRRGAGATRASRRSARMPAVKRPAAPAAPAPGLRWRSGTDRSPAVPEPACPSRGMFGIDTVGELSRIARTH
jgi:hypothetical protein